MEEMKQMVYKAMAKPIQAAFERNWIPDFIVRSLIRFESRRRLQSYYKLSSEQQLADLLHFVNSLKEMPIIPEYAVKQQEDLPLFKLVFGKSMKCSCSYFPDAHTSLDEAEIAMLELYCERSNIKDGHTVLDIACGYGSLLLYIAQKYSKCKVTGICYSEIQKEYIVDRCRDLKLKNVEILIGDICTFEMEGSYDRIMCIELFEHLKNFRDILKKISSWMKPDGLLFLEHFCHKTFAYHSEDVSDDEWLTQYFLRIGTMLSSNLLLYFQDDVSIENHWLVNGKHMARTCEEFLKRIDRNMAYIKPIMETKCGKDKVIKQIIRFKTTFTVMAELFGCKNGEEWMVANFLFKKK